MALPAACGTAQALFEISPRNLKRGQKAKDKGRRSRDHQREDQHPHIKLDCFGERNRPFIPIHLRAKRPHSPIGQQQPGSSAAQRQNQAFGQKLAGETRTPCAQRRANSKFVLASQTSRQEQIRHIRTSNQQNETHCDRQKQQGCADVAVFDAVFLEGLYRRGPAFVRVRMSFSNALCNSIHLCNRLLGCDSRLESRENSKESGVAGRGG